MSKGFGIKDTPWGIIYINSKDGSRRHKARCVYMQEDGTCALIRKCCGASQCECYKERKNIEVLRKKPYSGNYLPLNTLLKTVGTRIYHKATYSSNDGGFGTITEVYDEKIKISFDDGTSGNFTFPDCLKFLIVVDE